MVDDVNVDDDSKTINEFIERIRLGKVYAFGFGLLFGFVTGYMIAETKTQIFGTPYCLPASPPSGSP